MNKKLIAAAVAASVVAPVAYGGEVTLYGNITNALEFKKQDDEANPNDSTKDFSTSDVNTIGSRLGVKVSSDLGNGLTTSGEYEFATQSDNDGQAFDKTRIAMVGLSGGFGSFNVGQQWSTFYNTIGSFVSPNYTVSVGLGGHSRTGNTLKYTNSFGPVDLGVDFRVDDEEGGGRDAQGDGFGIGVVFHPTSNLSIGLAYDNSDGAETGTPVSEITPDNEIYGVAVKATQGNFWGSIGYQSKETDEVDAKGSVTAKGEVETDWYQIWVGTTLGEKTTVKVGFGEMEAETDGSPEDVEEKKFAFAVNRDMGGGLHFFLEFQDTSTETDTVDKDVDTTRTVAGLRLNF